MLFCSEDKILNYFEFFFLSVQKTIGIIAGVVAAMLIFIIVLVFLLKRAESERIREKRIEATRIIPRDMRPSKKSIKKPKDRCEIFNKINPILYNLLIKVLRIQIEFSGKNSSQNNTDVYSRFQVVVEVLHECSKLDVSNFREIIRN